MRNFTISPLYKQTITHAESPKRMQKLKTILASNPALSPLAHHADAQLAIQRAWNKVVPNELAEFCQVGALQNRRLTVLVANNAVAAKIKFLMPHLIAGLQAEKLAVSTLRTQLLSTHKPSKIAPQRKLPKQGSEALAQLADQLSSPLADQIRHLLANVKK